MTNVFKVEKDLGNFYEKIILLQKMNLMLKILFSLAFTLSLNTLLGQIESKKGTVRTYYPNGNLKSEFIEIEGNIEGIGKAWHENGKPSMIGFYKNGKRNGLQKCFNTDGTSICQITKAKLGKVYFEKTFFPNGKSGSIEKHRNRGGLKMEWYLNGNLKLKTKYRNGTPPIIEYDNNGNKILYINNRVYKKVTKPDDYIFKDSLGKAIKVTFNGITKDYFENGKAKSLTRYHNGEILRTKEWHENNKKHSVIKYKKRKIVKLIVWNEYGKVIKSSKRKHRILNTPEDNL